MEILAILFFFQKCLEKINFDDFDEVIDKLAEIRPQKQTVMLLFITMREKHDGIHFPLCSKIH